MREAEEASGGADSCCSCAYAFCVGGCCCCVPAGGHGACVGVVSTVIFLTKKDRIWPALREASTPQMLRALYAAISLRFGKFLISDPGVSLFGILPQRGERELSTSSLKSLAMRTSNPGNPRLWKGASLNWQLKIALPSRVHRGFCILFYYAGW